MVGSKAGGVELCCLVELEHTYGSLMAQSGGQVTSVQLVVLKVYIHKSIITNHMVKCKLASLC